MSRRMILQLVVVLLLAIVCAGSLPAQAMTPSAYIEWIHQFGSLDYLSVDDYASAVTARGDLYLVGNIQYTMGSSHQIISHISRHDRQGNRIWYQLFGSVEFLHTASDDSGVYVLGKMSSTILKKYDVDGNDLWTRYIVNGSAPPFDIATDSTGVYIVGITDGALPGQSSAGSSDAYIRKYDVDGNELWTRQFGTPSYDTAYAIAVGGLGVYVASRSVGTSTDMIHLFDTGGNELWSYPIATEGRSISVWNSTVYLAGIVYSETPYGYDTFIRSYDANGHELWFRQFDRRDTYPANVVVDGTGVYVVGGTSGALPGQTHAGDFDAYIRKYDFDGNDIWTHQYGSDRADRASSMAVDNAEIFVIGSTDGVLPGQTSSGLSDIFIRDYDRDGNELWTVQFGDVVTNSLYADSARSIVVNDGIYVAGDTGAALVGNTGAALPGQTSAGSRDAYLRKYGMDGSEAWVHQFGTPEEDSATSVAASGSDIYVVGNTRGALPQQTNAGGQDIYIRKYDSTGNEAWTHQFGLSWDDECHSVAVDSSSIYIVGRMNNSSPYRADAFIRKYDANGTEIWTRQFGGSGDMHTYWIEILDVVVDNSGVYVVGGTSVALPGQTFAGTKDAFVRKYDADGSEIWTRQFGTSTSDSAGGVVLDNSGIYVLVELNRDNEMGNTKPTNIIRKYDVAGNEIWTQEFGAPDGTYARSIAIDSTAVYVTGGTQGPFDGQLSAGGSDGFVLKFGLDGIPIWTKQFGTSVSDQMNGIALAESGVYVAGEIGDYYTYRDAVVLKLSKEAVPLSFLYLPAISR